MGLALSGWLCGAPAEITILPSFSSSSSSPSTLSFLAIPTSSRLSLLLKSAPVDPGDGRSCWSLTHCSPHCMVSACGEEVTRAPVQQSSDGARGQRGERTGLHLWEVLWSPAHRGSHAVIGISTQHCPMQTSGYTALVGRDSQSWGWELTTNQLWHGGTTLGMFPRDRQGKECSSEGCVNVESHSQTYSHRHSSPEGSMCPLAIPKRVLLVLDADAGTLGYIVDDSFLGVAFTDLPRGVELFPAISSVRGGATIRLRYLNGATRQPPALMALSGLSIRLSLGKQRETQTYRLPLPHALQRYLLPNL